MSSSTGLRRTLSATVAATSAVVLFTITACGGEEPAAPQAATTGSAQPGTQAPAGGGTPLIAEADVDALMAEITKLNNEANASFDTKLLKDYETESSLLADQAALSTADRSRKIGAFTYEVTGTRIPAKAGGGDFFVAETTISGSSSNYPLILTGRDDQWRIAHAVPLKVALPESRKDADGNAEVIQAADGKDLLAAPEAVARAHAAVAGSDASSDPMFAGDTVTDEVLQPEEVKRSIQFTVGGSPKPATSLTYRTEVSPHPVRALRTTDGGALVAYSTLTSFTGTYAGKKPLVKPQFAKLGRPGTGSQTLDVLGLWWALVPAKGAGETVTILGGTTSLVEIS